MSTQAAGEKLQLVGRSSSHFTRVAVLFAHELGVPFELVPLYDLTSTDAALYAGNPALKVPILRTGSSVLFGAENICRRLAELAPSPVNVVWPEQLCDDRARNAQELVWHGMAAQVQLVFGIAAAKLPADNLYFVKAREGFQAALHWLDGHLEGVLSLLPRARTTSLFEVTLFCLFEHIAFRGTLPLEPYPALARFCAGFSARPSAQRSAYRFDVPPGPSAPT